MHELRDMQKNPDPDIFIEMDGDTIENWLAIVHGPKDSPYEGGKFKLRLQCTTNYPMSPPTASFITKIFHPNVNFPTGEICLDILKTNWSPAWTLQYVCRAVMAMMGDPNADSPLNCDAGNLIRGGDARGFSSMARMYTIEHAMEGKTSEVHPADGPYRSSSTWW
jgi:peroxin-4